MEMYHYQYIKLTVKHDHCKYSHNVTSSPYRVLELHHYRGSGKPVGDELGESRSPGGRIRGIPEES